MTKRMSTRNTSRLVAFALTLALVPSALTACAPSAPAPKPAAAKLKIVASTSVWGSVIEAIAGDKFQITSIVDNPNQDPHSFEASVRDQAAVNSADLIFTTGNGYDDFMNPLIKASSQPASHVVALAANDKTVKPLDSKTVSDPHVWYDFEIVARIADTITARLSKLEPQSATTFAAANDKFHGQLVKFNARLKAIATIYRGCHSVMLKPGDKLCAFVNRTPIVQPESVGLRLLKTFAIDATPPSVRLAIQNESDISVQDMSIIKAEIQGEIVNGLTQFGPYTDVPVRWVVLNDQQTSAQIEQIKSWVDRNSMNTHIVNFSETLPSGKTYLTWMSANLAQLEALRSQEVWY